MCTEGKKQWLTTNSFTGRNKNVIIVEIVLQMPHSGYAKGDFSSIITVLEKQDGYPPVVRVGVKGLKITKSSFKDALMCVIENNYVST